MPKFVEKLLWQGDGNLVLYQGSTPKWKTSTANRGTRLSLQKDGHVVVYGCVNGSPCSQLSVLWKSAYYDSSAPSTEQFGIKLGETVGQTACAEGANSDPQFGTMHCDWATTQSNCLYTYETGGGPPEGP